ncbi:MAG: hypothetical protein AB7F23_07085 [Phycisphaerae bacterium]
MKRIAAVLFFCTLLFGAEVSKKDVTVRLSQPYESGYASNNFVSFTVSNHSESRSRDVRVSLTGGDGVYEVDFGSVVPGATAEKTVFVDLQSVYGAVAYIDGAAEKFSYGSYRHYRGNQLLLSEGTGTARVTSYIQGHSGNSILSTGFMDNEGRLDDVRVLDCYSAAMLTMEEWEALDVNVKEAIASYVRMGGLVVIWGEGSSVCFESSMLLQESFGAVQNYGFGRAYYVRRDIATAQEDLIKKVLDKLRTPVWNKRYDPEALDSFFVMSRDKAGKSVTTKVSPKLMARSFMVVSIFFLIVITLCLILRVRTSVFIILPLISIIVSAVVIAGANAYLGRDKYFRLKELTIVDQASGHSTTASVFAFYSPVEISGRLRLPVMDLCDRLCPQYDRRTIQIDENTKTIKSISLPGAPLAYRLRRDVKLPENQGLLFSRTADGVLVQNDYGKGFRSITYMSGEGKLWELDSVLAAGASAQMKPSDEPYAPGHNALDRFISGNWCNRINSLDKNLSRGCYFGQVNSPAVELDTDAEFDVLTIDCYVYGITGEEEK